MCTHIKKITLLMAACCLLHGLQAKDWALGDSQKLTPSDVEGLKKKAGESTTQSVRLEYYGDSQQNFNDTNSALHWLLHPTTWKNLTDSYWSNIDPIFGAPNAHLTISIADNTENKTALMQILYHEVESAGIVRNPVRLDYEVTYDHATGITSTSKIDSAADFNSKYLVMKKQSTLGFLYGVKQDHPFDSLMNDLP